MLIYACGAPKPTMMDKSEFRRSLEAALRNLRDVVRLGSMPLAAVLAPDAPRGRRGWELQAVLLRQLESLQPEQGQADSWPAHRYNLLTLRYVNGLSPDEACARLSVSRRHFYRQLGQALEEFADSLWEGLDEARRGSSVAAAPTTRDEWEQADQLELLRAEAQAAGAGDESCSLNKEVIRVLEVVGPIVQERHLGIHTALSKDLEIGLSPEILKQLLISLLGHFLTSNDVTELTLNAHGTDEGVCLKISWTSALPTDNDSAALRGLEQSGALALARLHGIRVQATSTGPDSGQCTLDLPTSSKQRAILIIDDNEDVCLLLERYLQSAGHRTITAVAGKQALEYARTTSVSAVTLDLMMRGEDGWDLLQSLRSDPATQELPIIVISVLDQEELALMLGATAFIRKPVMRDSLLQTLKAVLAQS